MTRCARLILVLAIAAVVGCDRTPEESTEFIDEAARRWVRVYDDTNYVVSVDTAHVGIWRMDNRRDVWFRTDHRRPHLRDGRAWSREVSRSLVRCDKLWYKVRSVVLLDERGRAISIQRTAGREFELQPWRPTEAGSVDELMAKATCSLGRGRR